MDASDKKTLSLLLVEDSQSDAELIIRMIKRSGFDLNVEQVQTKEEMSKALGNNNWDIILSDYNLPQFNALEALTVLHKTAKDIPFIVVSGAIGEDTAVAIMKAGAHDYVMKDNLARLIPAIERELREAELRHQKLKSEEAQKQLEEQLRQAQKMEAIGQLAGGVAHDFNNMLFIITGCTELIMEETPIDSPVRNNLEMIMGAAQRATTLVRQLLLFSRKSARKPIITDMNEIITNLMKMVRRVIGENIKLEFHPGFNLKTIYADPGQIEQIVMNLCINSRDAMSDSGGKIVIETQNIFIDNEFQNDHAIWQPHGLSNSIFYNNCSSEAKSGDYVVLTISDTGCGIPRELHERIFEPFFTTKAVGKGTGMGLAAVYGIVKAHDGMIHLYSENSSGTVFKIYIPSSGKIDSSNEKGRGCDIKQLKGNRETILIAEDEKSVRNMIANMLESSNYQVIAAEDGLKAIELFDQNSQNINIALLDVVMPIMGGDKVIEHIRKINPQLPVIFLTGYSRGMLPKNILSQTNYDTLQKPVARNQLLSCIKDVLNRKYPT